MNSKNDMHGNNIKIKIKIKIKNKRWKEVYAWL